MKYKSKSSSPANCKFPKDSIPLTCSQALAKCQGLALIGGKYLSPACLFLFDNGHEAFGGKCVWFRNIDFFVLGSF